MKRIEPNEQKSVVVQRRALRATRDLTPGTSDLEALPIPENGLEPYRLGELVGETLYHPLERGEHITPEHV